MQNINEAKIRRIADAMSAGLKCYYKIDTGTLIELFEYDYKSEDKEPPLELVEEALFYDENYVELTPMLSHDSFEIMQNFANFIDDKPFSTELLNALEKRKPFANFKWLVEGSQKWRNVWFEFRLNAHIEYVKEEVKYQISGLKRGGKKA